MRGALVVVVFFGLTAACGQPTSGVANLPRFEDFRVPSPMAARKDSAVVDRPALPEETEQQFDRRLANEARKGANFAGHYTVVLWSCGSPCSNVAILDARTGQRFAIPFAGVQGWGSCQPWPLKEDDGPLTYSINSSLLVATGRLETVDPATGKMTEGPCRRFYYQWTGQRLKLIRSITP